MKTCPMPGCGREIPSARFCCAWHWQRLPDYHRDRLSDAHFDAKRQIISDAELARVEGEVVAAMGGDTSAFETPHLCRHTCRRCGRGCLVVRTAGGGKMALDQMADHDDPLLWDGWHVLAVVGGVASSYPEEGGCYTPFVEHACGNPGVVEQPVRR
jgi:hypothetical protein